MNHDIERISVGIEGEEVALTNDSKCPPTDGECSKTSIESKVQAILDNLSYKVGRRLPIIQQVEAAECGLACLAMISTYHRKVIEVSDLRRRYPTPLTGLTLNHIIDIAAKLNLASRPIRLELNEIAHLRCPCILHWDFGHFVVLKSASSKTITIHDPAVGVRELSYRQVSGSFTGVALEVWPTKGFASSSSRQASQTTLKSLTGDLVGFIPLTAKIVAIGLTIEGLSLLLPMLTQWIIDYVIVSRDEYLLTTCALGFFALMLLQQLFTAMRGWMVIYLGTNLNVQWQSNVFSHLVKLPISYFQNRHLGDVISRLDSVNQIQNTITGASLIALLDGVMSVATLTMMFIYSWRLALIALIAAVLYVLLRRVTYMPLRGNVQEKIILGARIQSHVLETIRGIKAIKLFGREQLRRLNWLSLLVRQTNASLRTQRAQLIFTSANGVLSGLEKVLVLWLGAEFVLSGSMTVGLLMAFIAYKDQFAERITSLADKYYEFRMLNLYAGRLSDIVQTPPEAEGSKYALTEQKEFPGTIEVRGVSFRYARHLPLVLKKVDFQVEEGESVAIVGESGAGKTTLANILVGILRPTRGRVLIGGVSLSLIGSRILRKTIGIVSQDDTLFAGTIADNISFFAEVQDESRIEEVARQACIYDEIHALPMGFRTLVGDMGTTLSGGQKQRVLIARALYARPKILILDEATCHLDVKCEAAVSAAIKSLSLTRIIIAHRPETIATADRVVSISRNMDSEAGDAVDENSQEDKVDEDKQETMPGGTIYNSEVSYGQGIGEL